MFAALKTLLAFRSIPNLFWTAPKPTSLKPPVISVVMLVVGLTFFGLGQSFLVSAMLGASPWVVLSQGIAVISGISLGLSVFLVGLAVLLCWIPLKEKPGLGTLANTVIVASVIEVTVPLLPAWDGLFVSCLIAFGGVMLTGFGGALYLVAKLGPGPRDGLMTGLQRLTGLPIALVRNSIEVAVLAVGWFLGGIFGVGTILFALGIGPSIAASLYLFTIIFSERPEK